MSILSPERLTELRLDHGERLPVITVAGGAPPVMATVYAIAMLRSGGRSPNTIAAHLRAIMTAREWARTRGFSLEKRMQEGHLLNEREIEELVRSLRSRKAHKKSDGLVSEITPARRRAGVEAIRRHTSKTSDGVDPAVAASRVRFVREYLVWLARHSLKPDVENQITRMADGFSARAKTNIATSSEPRRGLEADQRALLLKLIDPDAPDNPFEYPPTRLRNALIVRLLYVTGARRGEIAGLKVRDIDNKAMTITIHRRGDDPDDPRTAPPRAKTAARKVPIDAALIRDLEKYVFDIRRAEPAARRHPFLFVSHRGAAPGAPLSTRQIGKIFEVLAKVLGFVVFPHLLRHTWNDRFSEMQDALPTPPAAAHEERVRCVLMGWVPQSMMAGRYSRRHIERAAGEAMLNLAKGIVPDE